MKKDLRELLSALEIEAISDQADICVSGIAYDSRKVKPGDLFVCIQGFQHDGHDFIAEAIGNGCVGVIVQRDVAVPRGVVRIKVSDTRQALARVANAFYDYPSGKLRLIGVTGTNGKTSTTHLIEGILRKAGYRTGLIGTIYNRINTQQIPVERTTPESLDLQHLFAQMVEAGVDYCVMEVSSHALSLQRVVGCDFDVGVFTNISQDHLDFHHTIEAYRDAKALLFSQLAEPSPKQGPKSAVINIDDLNGQKIARACPVYCLGYGVKQFADVQAKQINITPRGVEFNLDFKGKVIPIKLQLTGMFSVYNALAAIGVALVEGISEAIIQAALAEMPGVPGRFERIDAGQDFNVVVDYAHTPDGLENILQTAREFITGRIIIVFGCGGDRDRTKRPIMGKIAAQYADYVVITSDNPRSEDPMVIIADIERGMQTGQGVSAAYAIMPDRKEAITAALKMARTGDIVILAGKGHEKYQIIGEQVIPFDDKEVARQVLRGLEQCCQ
ncbi:MAG: UDP-N-acetylmuramoyl-L-alanyl-D-glutamate--2,6-diaminopimelate ligase [bacterium]